MDLKKLVGLFLRASQLFFTICVLGDISYEVHKSQTSGNDTIPTGYLLSLIACCLSLVTIGISLIMNAASVNIWAMFCWDVVLAILLAVSFVVTTNEVDGTLDSCTWDELNPFVSNSCKRLRAALIFSLVLAYVAVIFA